MVKGQRAMKKSRQPTVNREPDNLSCCIFFVVFFCCISSCCYICNRFILIKAGTSKTTIKSVGVINNLILTLNKTINIATVGGEKYSYIEEDKQAKQV